MFRTCRENDRGICSTDDREESGPRHIEKNMKTKVDGCTTRGHERGRGGGETGGRGQRHRVRWRLT